jgi:hypothetical protein
MLTSPVPDYFQEESEAALRSQVNWLDQQIGVGDLFFARVLRTGEDSFRDWRDYRTSFSPDRQRALRNLWQTFLHLLSFLNFDEDRVRRLLDQRVPAASGPFRSPLAPPWAGATLKAYLEDQGPGAFPEVDRWVTSFRFGDAYTA